MGAKQRYNVTVRYTVEMADIETTKAKLKALVQIARSLFQSLHKANKKHPEVIGVFLGYQTVVEVEKPDSGYTEKTIGEEIRRVGEIAASRYARVDDNIPTVHSINYYP